jgi:hypothetical protein
MVDFKCAMFVEGQQEDVVKIAVQSIIAIKRVKKLTGKNTALKCKKSISYCVIKNNGEWEAVPTIC